MLMGFGMVLTGLVLTVGPLVAIAYALGWRPRSQSGGPLAPQEKPALDILKERYAGGEITKEQYEEIRQTLS